MSLSRMDIHGEACSIMGWLFLMEVEDGMGLGG